MTRTLRWKLSASIEEIAVTFGFKQAAYFSRMFRRAEGMPPGQFRAQKVRQRKAAKGGFLEEQWL